MKLKWIAYMVLAVLFVGVLCMGYCKNRQAQINKNLQEAIARNRTTRPIYYRKGE